VMKKENVPTEKIFGDFLELLERDESDQFAGHLFQLIKEVLASTMNLGKEGYSPALNLTVYAKQRGGDKFDIIMRPSRTTSVEMFTVLKLDNLGEKLKIAMAEYGKETWGMTPVDEREDMRAIIDIKHDSVEQWKGVKK